MGYLIAGAGYNISLLNKTLDNRDVAMSARKNSAIDVFLAVMSIRCASTKTVY
jgi:hypothetical protein